AQRPKLRLNLSDYNEADLWQGLKQTMWEKVEASTVVCKIGVIPTEAVATLNKLESGIGLIHAGVGVGVLRFDSISIDRLLELRRWCENKGGFLTVLVAPSEIKQNLDVWGYRGNALDLMRKIKQQFDVKNVLNPKRFL
ncbi:MAG: FAD-binding oxidoreductase, partial [Okeania sp. SIO2H7]|nr:FAD-binding oxidoreductase [Okeania sp. SIO2H7]